MTDQPNTKPVDHIYLSPEDAAFLNQKRVQRTPVMEFPSDGEPYVRYDRADLAPMVKPLEWEEDTEYGESPHPWDAATIFGTVSVYYDPPFGWLAIRDGSDDTWVKYPGRSGDRGFDTAEDAMRFVDEYTAKRVSDVLTLAQITPAQAAIDALVEAAWQHIEAYPVIEDSDQMAKREALESALKAIAEEVE